MNKRFSPMKWAKAKTEMAIIFSFRIYGGENAHKLQAFF